MNNGEEFDEDAKYEQVPIDFPHPSYPGTVSGTQPKLLLTRYKGRYYPTGATPPEIFGRWQVCEDLAQQSVAKALESKGGKRSHMKEVDILDQYLPRLIATQWTSETEAYWIIRRAAAILGWPVPDAAAPTA